VKFHCLGRGAGLHTALRRLGGWESIRESRGRDAHANCMARRIGLKGMTRILSWDEAVSELRSRIPVAKRWIHVWGVVETSLMLAERHGQPLEQAAWAALWHDSAKCLGEEDLRAILESNSLAAEPEDWEHPAVWHALAGAHLARERGGIEDAEILDAIRFHPTGRAGMRGLELLIYVADYVEPSRVYPACRALRAMAFDAPLDETALAVCRNKLDHLRATNRAVHVRSLQALADLENRAGH